MNLQSGDEGSNVFTLNIAATCPASFVGTYTNWHWYDINSPVTYSSGKKMNSIVVWHYGDEDPTKATTLEVFYFTREYGQARWEGWNTIGPVETTSGCNGTHDNVFFGQHMYMTDCHDWTNTIELPVAINPLTNPMGHDFILSKNLLVVGDFAGGSIGPWNRTSPNTTDWSIQKDSTTNNYHLDFACWRRRAGENGCLLNSIYQDVDVSALYGVKTLRYGAILKAAKPARATIALHMIDSSNAVVGVTIIPADVSVHSWQHIDGIYNWNFDAKPLSKIRFEIYISDSDTLYSADESYLTPSI